MSFDVSGVPAHTRCLAVALSQGEGASVVFRADIIDLRKGGLMALAGRVATAGIIHRMELRGSFSAETGELEGVEWDQSHVMHEANRATKGECCRDPMERLSGLVGSRLGDGFVSALKNRFGGPLGCTHVSTLFRELSAFVGRWRHLRAEAPEERSLRKTGDRLAARSLSFDAFFPAEGGGRTDLAVRLADVFYAPADEHGSETLDHYDETSLLADVDLAGWQIRGLRARERSRRGPTCEDTAWTTRSDELDAFAGQSLGGGMARLSLERFSARAADARLLATLLSLGPGMTQVGVAVSNSLAGSSAARPDGMGLAGPGPCFMLRAEGPLMETLRSGGPPPSEEADSG